MAALVRYPSIFFIYASNGWSAPAIAERRHLAAAEARARGNDEA
jgi:hypothetical protein